MSEDHVYLDAKQTALICAICQVTQPIALPITLSDLDKSVEPFLDAHKDCDFKC
jgi:hypothetical protein